MLHQDYIMKMLMDLATAVMRTITLQSTQKDPEEAARSLEEAVGQAVALDGGAFLALAPDSIAQIMRVMGSDPGVSEYVARSILLASAYQAEAGNAELATLRRDQARAIAEAYGHDISDMQGGSQTMEPILTEALADFVPES